MPDDDVTGDLWEVVYDLDEGADRADIVRRLKQILARLGDREACIRGQPWCRRQGLSPGTTSGKPQG
jgi:hypothetical protein